MTGGVHSFRVRLFGVHRESAGTPALDIELTPGSTVGDLRAALASHPSIGSSLMVSAVAVNHVYASDDRTISEGDEVALIPPVAGG